MDRCQTALCCRLPMCVSHSAGPTGSCAPAASTVAGCRVFGRADSQTEDISRRDAQSGATCRKSLADPGSSWTLGVYLSANTRPIPSAAGAGQNGQRCTSI